MENLLFLQFLEHPAKKSGIIKQWKNPFDNFNEVELTKHFRLAKSTVHKLLKQKLQSLTSKICNNRYSYTKIIITGLQTASRPFHFLLAEITELDLYHLRQVRHISCKVVQLPCSGHTPHPTPAYAGASTVGM